MVATVVIYGHHIYCDSHVQLDSTSWRCELSATLGKRVFKSKYGWEKASPGDAILLVSEKEVSNARGSFLSFLRLLCDRDFTVIIKTLSDRPYNDQIITPVILSVRMRLAVTQKRKEKKKKGVVRPSKYNFILFSHCIFLLLNE